jgi:5-methylcytosine-specific restriction protein A
MPLSVELIGNGPIAVQGSKPAGGSPGLLAVGSAAHMNRRPLRVCVVPGCSGLTRGGRCPRHAILARHRAPGPRRPTTAVRGYGYTWQLTRLRILATYSYRCLWLITPPCPTPATDVDHRVPLRRGGTNDDHNLVPLCHAHHSEKTGREGRLRV